jgi:hypothetical protein
MIADFVTANIAQLTALAVTIGFVGTTLLLMMLMWRQMRRVNARGAERSREVTEAERLPGEPEYEEWDEARGQYVARKPQVNQDLLRQGAKARQTGWYMDL